MKQSNVCPFRVFLNKGQNGWERGGRYVRRWTKKEVKKFVEVLADSVNGFAFCLDRLALMKSPNNKFYEDVKKSFDGEIAKKEFIEMKEKSNFKEKKRSRTMKKLNTSITSLGNKFKSLKSEGCILLFRIKRENGLTPSVFTVFQNGSVRTHLGQKRQINITINSNPSTSN